MCLQRYLAPTQYAETPGALGVIARKIADAGVNIEALYLAHDNRNVLVSSDNEAARVALATPVPTP